MSIRGVWGKARRAGGPKVTTLKRPRPVPVAVGPVESARLARLHYVTDAIPGIHRERSGNSWTYLAPDGSTIHDPATLDRIRALAIPPAYTNVWICPDPLGHLQATGFDARGRKQYRYHPRYRELRDQTKFGRMLAFSQALPRIRLQVNHDLALPRLPRRRVLAAVVRILESTGIRIGNEEYARINHHFGLTTLHREHVAIKGAMMRFQFVGKHGKVYRCHITDRRLASIVHRCQELPGEELFKYIDDSGRLQTIGSTDVNSYIHEIAGQHFTAKDFRTWAGTILAVEALRKVEVPPTKRGIKAGIFRAIDWVAERLNNTRAVCRKYYVHPAVLEAFEEGILGQAVKAVRGPKHGVSGLDPFEGEVVALLRRRAAQV